MMGSTGVGMNSESVDDL